MAIDKLGSVAVASPEYVREIPAPSLDSEPRFGDVLESAIGRVDNLQVEADRQATAVAEGGGNLHEMALALEKADVAMRLAVKVRNKVVEAYQDIMRMGV